MGCLCSCVTVREATVRPVVSCGKFQYFALPGFNCLGPCSSGGEELLLSLHQSPVSIGTRTKDNVWVNIDVVVHWRVIRGPQDIQKLDKKFEIEFSEHHDQEPQGVDLAALSDDQLLYRASFSSESPLAQILSHTEEYFRICVAQYTMDKLFDLGNSITAGCQSILNRAMNEYGFCIQKVVINAIHPEERVRNAMNDIVASEKERLAQITRACADKERRIKNAEAEAEVSRLHGEGIASQRFAIMEGLRANVEEFAEAYNETHESVLALLLMSQYTDTLKDSIAKNNRVSLVLNANSIPNNNEMNTDTSFKNASLVSYLNSTNRIS